MHDFDVNNEKYPIVSLAFIFHCAAFAMIFQKTIDYIFSKLFFVLNSWFNFSGDGSSNSNKFAQYPRPKIVPVDYNKKKQVCVCEQCGGSWSRKEYYYHHKSVGKCTPKWIRYRWGSSDSFTLWFHQSRIPNLQKILTNIYFDFFFNWQTEGKKLFWANKKLCFFFNYSNWDNFLEKIGGNIWWICW